VGSGSIYVTTQPAFVEQVGQTNEIIFTLQGTVESYEDLMVEVFGGIEITDVQILDLHSGEPVAASWFVSDSPKGGRLARIDVDLDGAYELRVSTYADEAVVSTADVLTSLYPTLRTTDVGFYVPGAPVELIYELHTAISGEPAAHFYQPHAEFEVVEGAHLRMVSESSLSLSLNSDYSAVISDDDTSTPRRAKIVDFYDGYSSLFPGEMRYHIESPQDRGFFLMGEFVAPNNTERDWTNNYAATLRVEDQGVNDVVVDAFEVESYPGDDEAYAFFFGAVGAGSTITPTLDGCEYTILRGSSSPVLLEAGEYASVVVSVTKECESLEMTVQYTGENDCEENDVVVVPQAETYVYLPLVNK